jgi:hypothetical protein
MSSRAEQDSQADELAIGVHNIDFHSKAIWVADAFLCSCTLPLRMDDGQVCLQ